MGTYLVFDTNGLPIGSNFSSAFWLALFRLCEIKEIQPAISEVTLNEAVNMRREAVNKLLKPYVAAHAELSKMTSMEPIYTPTGDGIAKVYEEKLRDQFEVLPLDGSHAVEALRREARRVVPARLGKGGRDAAIWLTVAALANEGHEIYFITKNHKDFGHGGLFTELLTEVTGAAHPIQYLETANDFVGKIATSLTLPAFDVQGVADAFGPSVRAEVIGALEEIDSAEYTVDRALDAQISVSDVRASLGYVIDGRGLALIRARTTLSDTSGVQWAAALLDGWLEFEPGSFAPQESLLQSLTELEFR